MPTQEDYIKFKSVLEYFVSHLMYIQSNDTSSQGYHKYIKPLVDGKKFIFNGRQGGTLQRQIAEWNELSIGAIAVTFQNNFGQGYWTKKCYINWVDTGVNVFANWDTDGHIVSLCLAVYCGKNLIKYAEGFNFSLQDLGLFTPQQTDVFIKFTNKYFEMYQTLNQQEETALYCNLLINNHNLILTGAPGTGKTYLAKQIAKSMGCSDDEIGFVQFHPSYDYTDFVEGLRPMQDDNGTVGFERKDGVFKEFCKKALKNLKDSEKTVEKLQEEKTFEDLFKVLCEEIQNGLSKIKLRSNVEVDIVGMNKDCTAIYLMPQNSIRDERYTMSLNRLSKLSERFKTIEDLEAITNLSKSVAEAINGCQGSYYWATLRYIYEIRNRFAPNQSDVNSLKKVEKKSFVFIIDEINRGEISKIFGELFFSIDPGYRGLDEKGKPKGLVKTQYQNLVDEDDEFFGGFFVPENVYIIGTMNDIDRSVESMDFAFRRRFAFKEIKADKNIGMLDELGGLKGKAEKKMSALNEAISKISGLNSAYHIGGAYFLKLKNYDNDFNELWDNHLDGLLREYLRGRRQEEIEKEMKNLKQAYDSAN